MRENNRQERAETAAVPRYRHTQKGIVQPLLLAAAGLCLAGALINRSIPPWGPVLSGFAAVFAVLSFAFRNLTIADGGDRLLVRFGPISLFGKAVPYREIVSVERRRSSLLAGWGICWTPRGWLWNIGGFDCLRLVLQGGKATLLGTDDPDGLLAFIRERTGAKSSSAG